MITGRVKIILFIGILTLGCKVQWSSAQADIPSSNKAVVKNKDIAEDSNTKVYGSVSPVNYNGEDLKQFTLSQPLPNIWLILKGEEKINISEKAESILHQHWLKVLNHRYLTEIAEISKDINYQAEDAIVVQSTIDTENELLRTPIKSEVQSRNFSIEEARQLIIFLRDKSSEVIQKVKEIKNENSSNMK